MAEIIEHLFIYGLKLKPEIARDMIKRLDTYHRTEANDRCIILSFAHRIDRGIVFEAKYKLGTRYQPYGYQVSIEPDLTSRQLEVVFIIIDNQLN